MKLADYESYDRAVTLWSQQGNPPVSACSPEQPIARTSAKPQDRLHILTIDHLVLTVHFANISDRMGPL